MVGCSACEPENNVNAIDICKIICILARRKLQDNYNILRLFYLGGQYIYIFYKIDLNCTAHQVEVIPMSVSCLITLDIDNASLEINRKCELSVNVI